MTGVRISFHNFLSPYVLTRWIIVDDTVYSVHNDDDGNVRFIVKVSNPYSPLSCVSKVLKLLRFSFRNEIVGRLTHSVNFFSNRLSTQPSFMDTTSKAFTVGKGEGGVVIKKLNEKCFTLKAGVVRSKIRVHSLFQKSFPPNGSVKKFHCISLTCL